MDDARRVALTDPPGQMQKHPHTGADYYTGEQIITHRNRALGPFNWDWHPMERGFDTEADEVWATGRLTARYFDGEAWLATVKEATGWQVVNRKRNGGGFVSLGNDYKGADTDKAIADTIGSGCMPGWVAEVREEFFGPDGANDELEKAIQTVVDALTKASKAEADASAIVRDITPVIADLKAMKSNLENIRAAFGPKAARA